jgi:hypothetical protein
MARTPRRIFNLMVVSTLFVAALQTVFDLRVAVIESLGRRRDLTTRVPMWEELLSVAPNPIIGAGYDVFWATDTGLRMSERFGLEQAHNGYIEVYLSLGIIGLALLAVGILSGLLRIRRDLSVDYVPAVLRLCIVPSVVMYNWTEATFAGVSNVWLVLFLCIMNGRILSVDRASLRGPEEQRKLVDAVPIEGARFLPARVALRGNYV